MVPTQASDAGGAAPETARVPDVPRAPVPIDVQLVDVDDLVEAPPPKVGDPTDATELADLTTLAEQKGIPVEQAIAEYGWRFDFSLLAQEIREMVPGSYTYAAATGPRRAEIWFAAAAPGEALALIDDFERLVPGIDVAIRADVGLNESEINSALTSAHFAVFDQAGDAVSRFNYEAMRIEVTLPKSAAARSEDLATRATDAMADASPRARAEVSVTVDVSSFDVLDDDNTSSSHYGGEVLSPTCSSGPAFRNSSTGARRGSTAGHCGNSRTDDGDTLTWTQDYDAHWGDWQLHHGPDWESDNFYSGNSTVTETNSRDTSSGGVPVVGQGLCKNGRMTHKTCGDVLNPSICSGGNCFLIEMDKDMGDSGDSGGIVFWGRTVYGAHEGGYQSWPWTPYRGTFTRQDSVHEIWHNWYIATT